MIALPEEAWPKLDELTGDMRQVAELVGIGNALILAQAFDGTSINLYGWKSMVRKWRDRCIRSDYDTGKWTVITLARKYHLSDRQVSNILGRPDQ